MTLKIICCKCGEEFDVADIRVPDRFDAPIVVRVYPCERCAGHKCACGETFDSSLSQCNETKMCESCLDSVQ